MLSVKHGKFFDWGLEAIMKISYVTSPGNETVSNKDLYNQISWVEKKSHALLIA